MFYLVDDTVAAPPWNKGKLIRQKKRLKLREQAVPYEITGVIGNKISSTKIFNTSLPLARAYLPSPKTCHYTQVSPPRNWSSSMRQLLVFLFLSLFFALTAHSKTALVTGSNRGIGFEFVKQYAADGWRVIATSRSPGDDAELQALATANSNISIEELDVTDLEEIASLAKKYEDTPIDLLINNAGMYGDRDRQAWGQLDRELFRQILDVNVFGPLKISEAFAPHVAASEGKKIAVVSSVVGSIAGVSRPPASPYYAISKAAVNMAMRGTAMRLKPQGIAVAILHPGGVDTRMLRTAFGASKDEAESDEEFDYGGFSPLTTEESVSQMRATIEALTLEGSGEFLQYDGKSVPW
jgi:NAD(P)-dependent dehydrogenase (short-subunit alcohol dehydrogenase family)